MHVNVHVHLVNLYAQVAEREKEIDTLRSDLQSLSATLENAAVHQREDIHREQVRVLCVSQCVCGSVPGSFALL